MLLSRKIVTGCGFYGRSAGEGAELGNRDFPVPRHLTLETFQSFPSSKERRWLRSTISSIRYSS